MNTPFVFFVVHIDFDAIARTTSTVISPLEIIIYGFRM